MKPFAIGDKVRITSNSNYSENSVGDIGVITECEVAFDEYVVDCGKGHNLASCWTMGNDMEHVGMSKFGVGDKVRVIAATKFGYSQYIGEELYIREFDNGDSSFGLSENMGGECVAWVTDSYIEAVGVGEKAGVSVKRTMFDESMIVKLVEHNQNILIEGPAGCGKTSLVKQALDDAEIEYWFLNGATIDPFLHFLGLPNIDVASGQLNFALPPEVQAASKKRVLVIDEINRTDDRVLNGMMELIQFKKVNGHDFGNFQSIIGLMNPEDDEGTYKVNSLDKAFIDRFHVRYKMPAILPVEWLSNKFGSSLMERFVEWHESLDDGAKLSVSARRAEYVLNYHQNIDPDLSLLLPAETNPDYLSSLLSTPVIDWLKLNDEGKLQLFRTDTTTFHKLVPSSELTDMMPTLRDISEDLVERFWPTEPEVEDGGMTDDDIRFNFSINKGFEKEINVIKELRRVTGLGLREAVDVVKRDKPAELTYKQARELYDTQVFSESEALMKTVVKRKVYDKLNNQIMMYGTSLPHIKINLERCDTEHMGNGYLVNAEVYVDKTGLTATTLAQFK